MITRQVAERLETAQKVSGRPAGRNVRYRRDDAGHYELEPIVEKVAGVAEIPGEPTVEAPPRVAILAIHGMGEQVRFETMERVALGLCRLDGQDPPQPRVADVAFEDFRVQRLEVTLHDSAGSTFDAHIYEGYWAPLTEGQVMLRDVFRFLLQGTLRGIPNLGKPFYRWMFGKPVAFEHFGKTTLALAIATVLLAELAGLNVLVPLIAAARLGLPGSKLTLPNPFFRDITLVLDGVLFLWLLVFGLLYTALHLKSQTPRGVRTVIVATLWVTLAAFVFLPVAAVGLWLWPLPVDPFDFLTSGLGTAVTWGGLLAVTLIARSFLIHYVGDVAAYISPQTLDRFTELRKKIQDDVAKVALAFMSSRVKKEWEYDRVAIVGHSLGSVIAYDMVNRLIAEDLTGLAQRHSRDRVRLLLTFGSPLDKTAYIYGLHGHATSYPREQLAAKVQPLIDDYAYRENLVWVNIHSPYDIVSGSLKFYDNKKDPSYQTHRVRNEVDEKATIPLAAHEQYWDNSLLWTKLRDGLLAPSWTSRREQN